MRNGLAKRKDKAMKANLTELVFIVDRSGSMGGLETDTIGGFNATLEKHRKAKGEALVSTVLFDNKTIVLHDRQNIVDVAPLTDSDYQVRGCTALLDAVGGSIRHISRVHGYLPDEYRPEKTIFVIITDGYENASVRYDYVKVKAMIKQKQELGWEFLFLGANIDAVGEATRLGIEEDRAVTYLADSIGQRVAYGAVADATCAMRSAPANAARIGAGWKKSVERDTAKRSRKTRR